MSQLTKESLKKFVLENPKMVSMRESESHPGLFVLKYAKRVFYDDLWNDILEETRGLVIDRDFNIVSYPFTKIYNIGVESRAPVFSPDEDVTVFVKVNGFMLSVTSHEGKLLLSTTGSLDSDFVKFGWFFITPWIEASLERICRTKNLTLMFECVHPNDPHIIDEQPGLYFIGYRKKEYGSTVDFYDVTEYSKIMKEVYDSGVNAAVSGERVKYSSFVQNVKYARNEGYVVYGSNGRVGKIKTKYYLVQKALARKKDILSLRKDILDEEFYPLYEHLKRLGDTFTSMDEQQRLEYIRKYLNDTN